LCGSAATGDTAIVRCRAYRAHGKELYTLHDRDRIGSFWGRLETSMLKLAALHQLGLLAAYQDSNAATEDAVIVIDPEALDLAIALVEHLKRGLVVLFGRNWRPAALLRQNRRCSRSSDTQAAAFRSASCSADRQTYSPRTFTACWGL